MKEEVEFWAYFEDRVNFFADSFADRPDWRLGGKEEREVQCDFKFLAYTTSVTELSLKH